MRKFAEHERKMLDFYVAVSKSQDTRIVVESKSAQLALRARCYSLTKIVKQEFDRTGHQEEAYTAVKNVGLRFVEADGKFYVEFFRKDSTSALQQMAQFQKQVHMANVDTVNKEATDSAERVARALEEDRMRAERKNNAGRRTYEEVMAEAAAAKAQREAAEATTAPQSQVDPPEPLRASSQPLPGQIDPNSEEPWPDDFDPMNSSDPRHWDYKGDSA